MDHSPERLAYAALSRLFEPGTSKLLGRWVAEIGAVDAVDRLTAGRAPADVQGMCSRHPAEPRRLLDDAEAIGARLVIPADDEYPVRSWTTTGDAMPVIPPMGLWVRGAGNLREALDGSVAIVGSRASTSYGDHVAADLAHGLVDRQRVVVSGLALGIDAAAHRGAIAARDDRDSRPVTIGVLASGVNRVYPASNRHLFERMQDTELLVSEYPVGAAPLTHRFLTRNRLIAGLASGLVVVEAAARSGALSAARRALSLSRYVMAVPGPTTSAMSVGVHQLLRNELDVRLVTSAAEIDATMARGVRQLGGPR